MTGLHFLGCKSCGTYDRHNQLTQVALAYLRNELKFTGSTSSVDSNYVGTSADGKSKHTDGQVWGSLSWLRRLAIDVSVVNPTAVSQSGAGAWAESFLNPNAGTRAAEETKTKKYKLPERPALSATKLESYDSLNNRLLRPEPRPTGKRRGPTEDIRHFIFFYV